MPRWENQQIRNATQQLQNVKEAESSVQIINDLLEECKLKITTSANQGDAEIRRCGDFFGEYDRGLKQSRRYEFCKHAWEGYVTIWMIKSNTLGQGRVNKS